MASLAKQIGEFTLRAEEDRCRMLEAELRVCLAALSLGGMQAAFGLRECADYQAGLVKNFSETIQETLLTIHNDELRQRFSKDLGQVEQGLSGLRKRIDAGL